LWQVSAKETAGFMVSAAKADDTGDDVGACALKPARPLGLPTGQIRLDDLLQVCRTGEQIDQALLNEILMLFVNENRSRIVAALAAAVSTLRSMYPDLSAD
jgi:hypothetical protein